MNDMGLITVIKGKIDLIECKWRPRISLKEWFGSLILLYLPFGHHGKDVGDNGIE